MKITAEHLISITCVICAAIVSATGNDGWGWFLLVAVIVAS